jgi:hypothetical protein
VEPAGGAAVAAPEGVRSQARRHPLTSQRWALETPQPCQAWHGRELRGPTARSVGSSALGKTMYIGLLKNQFLCNTGAKISLSARPICFLRSNTNGYNPTMGGGTCTSGAFDGGEGTAGLAVGRGRWSRWWQAGKHRQTGALARRRQAMCQSNLPGGEARHGTCRWSVASGGVVR